jgi:glucose-1-phosphate thymidylyltransferase
MKGVVLAGGLGTRLLPMTAVTNKHLLPIYDRPMIFYPVQTLVQSGIDEILIVTGGDHAGGFLKLLGDGKKLGIRRLYYAYQEGEGGVADALLRAEGFALGEPVCVILGDNIFEHDLRAQVDRFSEVGQGARVLLKEVSDPGRFGIPELKGDRVVRIVEKPANPPSKYAVVGVYLCDHRVFDIVKCLEPSQRGELEIADVINQYIEWGELSYDFVDGWWFDAGTPDAMVQAAQLIAARRCESS